MTETRLVAPSFEERAFTCPYCGVLASQYWKDLVYITSWNDEKHETDAKLSECGHCTKELLWWNRHIVAPAISSAPFAHADMPPRSLAIYNEARRVLPHSARAAAALLRLCVEILVDELGAKIGGLDKSIKKLVEDGLSITVQQALDVVRVVGNHAVHPGQIDINDDEEIANALFTLTNYIVERMITEPNKIGELFDALPPNARNAIEKRDKKMIADQKVNLEES